MSWLMGMAWSRIGINNAGEKEMTAGRKAFGEGKCEVGSEHKQRVGRPCLPIITEDTR